MAKNLKDLRFGTKDSRENISNVWRLWVTKHGDIYLATRAMGGIVKYSFHQSGICRYAHTSEAWGAKEGDRALNKWKRRAIPARGKNQVVPLAMLAMPTNFLSRESEETKKKVHWLPAAPENQTIIIELVLTSEPELDVRNNLSSLPERTLFDYVALTATLGLVISYYHREWDNKDLTMSATGTGPFPEAILLSEHDPDDTGRPIRVCLHTSPKDGEPVQIRDLGGYKVLEKAALDRLYIFL
jgi:hypothetical protein